jgi:hypothetical protein
MHHNTIMTECITPETTPIIYALFHTYDVRVIGLVSKYLL